MDEKTLTAQLREEMGDEEYERANNRTRELMEKIMTLLGGYETNIAGNALMILWLGVCKLDGLSIRAVLAGVATCWDSETLKDIEAILRGGTAFARKGGKA